MNATGSTVADEGVSLAFHYSTIGSGESVTLRYRYYFASSDTAVPVVDLDANNSSGTTRTDYTASFTEGGSPVLIGDTDATVFDSDSANLTKLVVTLTNRPDGVQELLVANTAGTSISASYSSGTGVLTLSGSDTIAHYRQVLRTVTYENTSQNPDTTQRIITVVASDGTSDSQAASAYINVNAINDAPTLTTPSLTISEGQTLTLTSSDIQATDVENSDAAVVITVNSVTAGHFALASDPLTPITAFTQLQINASQVVFVHGGGEAAPTFTLTASDGVLSDGPKAGTITFTNVNDAPALTTNALTLSEGATVVLTSAHIHSTDIESGPTELTYTVSGLSGGQFELVSSGSTITSFTQDDINNARVRYVHNGGEAAPAYSLTLSDSSANVGPSAAVVTFTNVNDAPAIGVNSLTISEGGSVVLGLTNLSTTDPDNTPGQLTYTASNVSYGQFELVAVAGAAIMSFTQADINAGLVQFVHDGGDTAPAYDLTVSDGSLIAGPSSVSVTFTASNDAPTISDVADQTINEDTTLGPLTFTIGDSETAATALVVTAASSDGTRIPDGNIVLGGTGTNRTVTITPALNQNGGPVTITLTVSDGGLTTVRTFTVNVTPVNDLPVIAPQGFTVNENSTTGTLVGTVIASDIDAGAVLTYAIDAGNSNGAFAIDSATGQVTVANPAALNFETTPQYLLTVSVTDSVSVPQTATITIRLLDVNEVPTSLSLNNASVNENSLVGTPVGQFSSTDVDAGDAATYSLVDDAGGLFAVDPLTGEITVNGALDFETSANHTIIARVTDNGMLVLDRTYVISVVDLNEAPVLVSGAFGLPENSSNGTLVGTISASDVDAGDALTFSLVSGNTGGAFTIDANTGAITVANTAALDFETNGTFTLMAQVADLAGLTHQQTVTVTLSDVNEQPTVLAGTYHINEWSSVGSLVGLVAASDVDAGDLLTYTFVAGNTGGRFAIDSNTGEITVANSANFTHESQSSFTITVQVQDTSGLTHTADMTVIVDNVNEPPVAVDDQYTLEQFQTLTTVAMNGVQANDTPGPSPGGRGEQDRLEVACRSAW